LLDAPRPAPQSGANRHSHAERGNEEKSLINYFRYKILIFKNNNKWHFT